MIVIDKSFISEYDKIGIFKFVVNELRKCGIQSSLQVDTEPAPLSNTILDEINNVLSHLYIYDDNGSYRLNRIILIEIIWKIYISEFQTELLQYPEIVHLNVVDRYQFILNTVFDKDDTTLHTSYKLILNNLKRGLGIK